MEVRTDRKEEFNEVEKIDITIGDTKFRITETFDGKLSINKIADDGSPRININPIVSNEIEIS